MTLLRKIAIIGMGMAYGLTAGADVMIDGQIISSTDITSISIDPNNGDIAIDTVGGYTLTNDNGGGGSTDPLVVINSFSASAGTVTEGDSVTLSWTTTYADSCSAELGFGSWTSQTIGVPSGTSSPIVMTTEGTYTFRVRCQNAAGSKTRVTTVVVEPVVSGPPAEDCSDVSLGGQVVSWNDVFGANWPDPRYREDIVTVPRTGYLAIEFNTGNKVDDGGFLTIKHTSTGGTRLGSISRCAGDFSNHLPDDLNVCTQVWGLSGTVFWSTQGVNAAGNECSLEPNTTYYLNLTFTDGVTPNTTNCDITTCRTFLRAWH